MATLLFPSLKTGNKSKYCSLPGHTNKPRTIICLNDDCTYRGYICSMCLFTYHQDHMDQCVESELIKLQRFHNNEDLKYHQPNLVLEDAIVKIGDYLKTAKIEMNEFFENVEKKTLDSLRGCNNSGVLTRDDSRLPTEMREPPVKDLSARGTSNLNNEQDYRPCSNDSVITQPMYRGANENNNQDNQRHSVEWTLSKIKDHEISPRLGTGAKFMESTGTEYLTKSKDSIEGRESVRDNKNPMEMGQNWSLLLRQKEEEIKSLQTTTKDLNAVIEKLREEKGQLEKIVEERNGEMANFEKSKQVILDKITAEKLRCMVDNDNLRKDVEKRDIQIAELTAQQQELSTDVVKMTQDLSDELDKKQMLLNEKAKEVTQLNYLVDDLRIQLDKINGAYILEKEAVDAELALRANEISILKGSNDYLRKRAELKENSSFDEGDNKINYNSLPKSNSRNSLL